MVTKKRASKRGDIEIYAKKIHKRLGLDVLTLADVVEETGIKLSGLQLMIRGHADDSVNRIQKGTRDKLAAIFGITVAEFMRDYAVGGGNAPATVFQNLVAEKYPSDGGAIRFPGAERSRKTRRGISRKRRPIDGKDK